MTSLNSLTCDESNANDVGLSDSTYMCSKSDDNANIEFSIFDDEADDREKTHFQRSLACAALIRGELACNKSNEDSNDWRNIVICLVGRQFRTRLSILKKYPMSRLGIISNAKSRETIDRLCDGFSPGTPPVFFFDRNPQNFGMILDMYRREELHICPEICSLVIKEEFDYWGLDEIFLQPCCALKYFPQTVKATREQDEEKIERLQYSQRLRAENFGSDLLGKLRSRIWDLLEYPETSRPAQILAFTSMSFTCLSTITFVVDSTLEKEHVTKTENDKQDDRIADAVKVLDDIAIIFFTLEYLTRLVVCPRKKLFFFNWMNFVDLVAIIPFYFSILLQGLEDLQIIGKAGKIVRLIRMMRILRIFKMVRHFVGLQSLIYTLHQAYRELGLILIIVGVTILMFASLLFAFEQDGPNSRYWLFYDCIWWAFMTLTTVGYHIQPDTFMGKLACGLCALCGVFIITLPIPIVVSSFAVCYRDRLWRNEIAARKRLIRGSRRKNSKSEILFNLANSSGMSGVRKASEILPNGSKFLQNDQL